MRQFLTAAEFARIIGKDPKTVVSWVKKKWITGVKKVGKVYQIPLNEVETYKDSSEYPPRPWQK